MQMEELIHELLHPDWQGELKIVFPKELKMQLKIILRKAKV